MAERGRKNDELWHRSRCQVEKLKRRPESGQGRAGGVRTRVPLVRCEVLVESAGRADGLILYGIATNQLRASKLDSMLETELLALLDAHDALVAACAAGELSFSDFLSAYGGFPHNFALDGHESPHDELTLLKRFRQRIAFHFQVAGVLSGVYPGFAGMLGEDNEVGRFAPAVGMMRLKQLAARHPKFECPPPPYFGQAW